MSEGKKGERGRRHAQRGGVKEGLVSRRTAIKVGGGLAAAAFLAYLAEVFGLPKKDKISNIPLQGTPLSKDSLINLGRLNLENQSKVVNMSVIPENLPDDIAIRIGLKSRDYPITIFLQDTLDADPTYPGDQGAASFYDPKTNDRYGVVAVSHFLNFADSQRNLPNSPIKDQDRYNNYLGVLLSQSVVVEAYNQGHMQGSMDSVSGQTVDKEANQLGVEYVDRIKKGLVQPFIVVNGLNR